MKNVILIIKHYLIGYIVGFILMFMMTITGFFKAVDYNLLDYLIGVLGLSLLILILFMATDLFWYLVKFKNKISYLEYVNRMIK